MLVFLKWPNISKYWRILFIGMKGWSFIVNWDLILYFETLMTKQKSSTTEKVACKE